MEFVCAFGRGGANAAWTVGSVVSAGRETVYEWYYKYYLAPWFIISPDLQVLTHTGGDKDAPSTIIGGVRIRVIF